MAVTNDIGAADNIHPKNKKEVGRRLALWALANDYGQDLVFSGPLYSNSKIDGAEIRVHFDHANGLKSRDGKPLERFEIAGEDRIWHWADARIDDDTVIVSSAEVTKPAAVRYAWSSNPEGANLINKEGLPASVFRSDDWPIE
jgi:sialate O-acetylesterase